MLAVGVLGLILGCFSTALVYRAARGIPWGFMKSESPNEMSAYRSACTSCKTVLSPRDLVPVLSWLLARGKCRHCGCAIGVSYPLTEIGVALACLAAYAVMGPGLETAFVIAAAPFLFALLIIDARYLILPDSLIGALAVIGAANKAIFVYHEAIVTNAPAAGLAFQAIIIAPAVYGILAWFLGFLMSKLLKKDALGFGDVKFFALAGLWLGLHQLGWFCVVSGALGVVLGLIWKAAGRGDVFPFGPALIATLYLLLIF